jgi:hypothetical protein
MITRAKERFQMKSNYEVISQLIEPDGSHKRPLSDTEAMLVKMWERCTPEQLAEHLGKANAKNRGKT